MKINDVIFVTGTMITARDEAHRRALEFAKEGKKLPVNLEGLAIFHCGPLMKKENEKWVVVSAGPTTSARMCKFEDEFIENFKIRVIVGKGGMGRKTTEVMKKHGVIYGAYTGGAGVLAGQAIKKVKKVEWLDLGMPEALWVFEVKNFGPLTVAIDTYGNNLFEDLKKNIEGNRQRIFQKLEL